MNNNIELNLTLDEINVIMSSLAKQPYEVVFGLVEKIRNQAQLQLSKSEEVVDTISV
jgi:hypothetical protein